jgi:lysophospholipase L1-like esterase
MQFPSFPLLSSRRQVLSAGLLAAFGSVAALELLGTAEAGATSESKSSGHSSSLRPSATRVSVIGDSLTIGTLPYQSEAFASAGWGHCAIDAYGARGIRTKLKKDKYTGLTAVDAIRQTSGDSDLWVVALGTNDAGIYAKAKHAEVIGMMMDKIGSAHTVIWVNVYLPKTPQHQANWNRALATVAKERGDEMFVFDWASLVEKNPTWMADDQFHCSKRGYEQRASAIALATRDFVPSGVPEDCGPSVSSPSECLPPARGVRKHSDAVR